MSAAVAEQPEWDAQQSRTGADAPVRNLTKEFA